MGRSFRNKRMTKYFNELNLHWYMAFLVNAKTIGEKGPPPLSSRPNKSFKKKFHLKLT